MWREDNEDGQEARQRNLFDLPRGHSGSRLSGAAAAEKTSLKIRPKIVSEPEKRAKSMKYRKKYCPKCNDRVRHSDSRCRHCGTRLLALPVVIVWTVSISLATVALFLLLNYVVTYSSKVY